MPKIPGCSYCITVVVPGNRNTDDAELAKLLQVAYDNGNIAGSFDIELIGETALFIFTRNYGEDADVVGVELTPESAALQLCKEFAEFLENGVKGLECPTGSRLVVQGIMHALNECQFKVEGLPCQKPRLKVSFEMIFESADKRDAQLDVIEDQINILGAFGVITNLSLVQVQ